MRPCQHEAGLLSHWQEDIVTSNRPIIVVGCPRSGTTLLQVMLHAHPRIAIPPENRFVLPVYQNRWQFGDLRDPDNRRRLAKRIVKGKKSRFRDFGLNEKEVIEDIVAAPPTLGSAFAAVFQAYARQFGKPRWGDKRPAYTLYLDVIRELFPDAQFVNIVRDGRDCVASLKEMSWYRHDFVYAVTTWALSVDVARHAVRELPADSFHELRYEDLVADPEGELRSLCEFLGEEYDPAMAEPATTAEVAVPERKQHHARTRGPVTAARVGSWQQRLEPWEISLCEAVLGDRLRSYGYDLSGAPRPSLSLRLRYHWIYFRRRFPVRRLIARERDRMRRLPPVAAVPPARAADRGAP